VLLAQAAILALCSATQRWSGIVQSARLTNLVALGGMFLALPSSDGNLPVAGLLVLMVTWLDVT
jgi:hypothetical protein